MGKEKFGALLVLGALLLSLCACGQPGAEGTPSPSPEPVPSAPAEPSPTPEPTPEPTPAGPNEADMTVIHEAGDSCVLLDGEQLYLRSREYFGPLPAEADGCGDAWTFGKYGAWQGFGGAPDECLVNVWREGEDWTTLSLRWAGDRWESVSKFNILAPKLDGILDEEQKQLYLDAQDLSLLLFGGNTSDIDGLPGGTDDRPMEPIQVGDYLYGPVKGYYASWDTLYGEITSLFTERWWKGRNERNGFPTYVERDGWTYYLDTSIGDNPYNGYFPDEYRLTEQTEDKISFVVTGHYSWIWPIGDESYDERDARRMTSWDWTVEFPAVLVRTEDGWRFDEFAVPADSTDANFYDDGAEDAWYKANIGD